MRHVLWGASNPETIRVIRAMERSVANFSVLGFLDNDLKKHGTSFLGYPVLGGSEEVRKLAKNEDVRFVNLITGSMTARLEVSRDIIRSGGILGNLIHPTVDLTMTTVGAGAYMQESVILQAHVEVGDNSSLHMNAIVGHESKIGNTVFIAHAVSISGACEIGDGTFVGTNATILPHIKIGKWCIIGAGAVVTKDVPDYTVVVGNPARKLKENNVPYKDGTMAATDQPITDGEARQQMSP